MKLFLILFTFALGFQFAQSASATVDQWMETEAEEICNRDPICSGDPRYIQSNNN